VSAISDGLAYLRQAQGADAGWGYLPRHASFVEPTALVLLAMTGLGEAAPGTGWAWLLSAQRSDGAWGVGGQRDDPSWMSAWAVWGLAADGREPAARENGARWLLSVSGLEVADPFSLEATGRLMGIDPTLHGWPWQPGQAGWVLPTSLGMLALSVAGYRSHPRVADGLRYLRDRACAEGGWNFGNPIMFGKGLPPTVQETALALIAMERLEKPADDGVMARGLDWLMRSLPERESPQEIAWGLLALKALGAQSGVRDPLAARLSRAQAADGGWQQSTFVTAAAVLALSAQGLAP
jgi:hypothetical protein